LHARDIRYIVSPIAAYHAVILYHITTTVAAATELAVIPNWLSNSVRRGAPAFGASEGRGARADARPTRIDKRKHGALCGIRRDSSQLSSLYKSSVL